MCVLETCMFSNAKKNAKPGFTMRQPSWSQPHNSIWFNFPLFKNSWIHGTTCYAPHWLVGFTWQCHHFLIVFRHLLFRQGASFSNKTWSFVHSSFCSKQFAFFPMPKIWTSSTFMWSNFWHSWCINNKTSKKLKICNLLWQAVLSWKSCSQDQRLFRTCGAFPEHFWSSRGILQCLEWDTHRASSDGTHLSGIHPRKLHSSGHGTGCC